MMQVKKMFYHSVRSVSVHIHNDLNFIWIYAITTINGPFYVKQSKISHRSAYKKFAYMILYSIQSSMYCVLVLKKLHCNEYEYIKRLQNCK